MKKILFIAILLIITTACSNDHNAKEAKEEPMLIAWQTNISNHRLWADNLGFIEDDSVKIRTLVENLRIQAKANDTLVVSCLMLSSAAKDTAVYMYGIK